MNLSRILGKNVKSFIEQPVELEKEDIKKPIALFDFFKCFFSTNKQTWEAITDNEKMNHSFMLMQFLSIKAPEISTMCQNMISPAIIDCLHLMFSKNCGGKSPGWMYTKINKIAEYSIDLKKYDKSIVQKIKDKFNLDSKDFKFLMTEHSDVLENLLKDEQSAMELKKIK